MWVLEIKQRVPSENYFLDEKVVFKSKSLTKLTNIIEYLSLVEQGYETEWTITKEVNDGTKEL